MQDRMSTIRPLVCLNDRGSHTRTVQKGFDVALGLSEAFASVDSQGRTLGSEKHLKKRTHVSGLSMLFRVATTSMSVSSDFSQSPLASTT